MGIDVKTVARVIVNHDVCASVSWTHAPHERLATVGEGVQTGVGGIARYCRQVVVD